MAKTRKNLVALTMIIVSSVLGTPAFAQPFSLQSGEVEQVTPSDNRVQTQNTVQQQTVSQYVVQFDETLTVPQVKERLPGRTNITSYVPEDAWLISSTASAQDITDAGGTVEYLGRYSYSVPDSPKNKEYSIRTVPGTARDVAKAMSQNGISAQPLSGSKVVVDNRSWKLSDKKYESVISISQRGRQIKQHNAEQRKNIDSEALQNPPQNLKGQGFTAGVWDLNISGNHADLNYSEKRIEGDPGSPVGDHATHVAGTLLGGGKIDSKRRGIVPEARLVTYNLSGSRTIISKTNESINRYNNTLSQNSWGYRLTCSTLGNYVGLANNYDQYISNRSTNVDGSIPTVFSAGNQGDSCGREFNTTTAPGNAKNTVTVGALNGDGSLASFSATGPTDSGRIKPTVVALGTQVNSTLPNNLYGIKQGTSMAAPAVAGGMIQIMQKHNQSYGYKPDPETVKAILVHTAEPLGVKGPDFKYGWGRPNITRAVQYVETAESNNLIKTGGLEQGQQQTYQAEFEPGTSPNITLVWNDPPATEPSSEDSPLSSSQAGGIIVNDLDLVVETQSQRYYPWTKNYSQRGQPAVRTKEDSKNPVETVYLPEVNTSTVDITVKADSVPKPSQNYTLLISRRDGQNIQPEAQLNSPVNQAFGVQPNVTVSSNVKISEAVFEHDGTNHSMRRKSTTSFTNTTKTFPEGKNTVKVYINDTDGTPAQSSVSFTVDTEPPQIDIQKPVPNRNTSSELQTKATATDGNQPAQDRKLYVKQNSSVQIQKQGLNNTVSLSDLSQGTAKIVFSAAGPVGNTVNKTRQIKIDRTKPQIQALTPKYVSGSFDVNASTTDNQAVNTFKYNITKNNQQNKTGTLNNTVTTIPDSQYNITYTAVDYAGNKANETERLFADSAPPEITFKQQPSHINKTPNIDVAATDQTTSVDNISVTVFNNTFSATVPPNSTQTIPSLKPGRTYTLQIDATDKANNTRSNTVQTETDFQAPELTPTQPSNNTIINGTTSFKMTSTDNNSVSNKTVSFKENNQIKLKKQVNTTLDTEQIQDANYTVIYSSVDAAGNKNSTSINAVVDNQPPQIQANNLEDQSNVSGTVQIEANIQESAGIRNVTYNVSNTTGVQIKSNNITEEFNTETVQEGEYNISINATSLTNRTAIKKIENLSVDNTNPDLQLEQYPPQPQKGEYYKNNLTVEATCQDTLTGVKSISNQSSVENQSQANFTVETRQQQEFICKDQAGNNETLTPSYQVDSSPPLADAIIPSNQTDIEQGTDIVIEISEKPSGVDTDQTTVSSPNTDIDSDISEQNIRISVDQASDNQQILLNLELVDQAGLSNKVTLEYTFDEEQQNEDSGTAGGSGGGGGGGSTTSTQNKNETDQQTTETEQTNNTEPQQQNTNTDETEDRKISNETNTEQSSSKQQQTRDRTSGNDTEPQQTSSIEVLSNNSGDAVVTENLGDENTVAEVTSSSDQVDISVSKQYLEQRSLQPGDLAVESNSNAASYTITDIKNDSVVYSVKTRGDNNIKLVQKTEKGNGLPIIPVAGGLSILLGIILISREFVKT